MGFFDKLFGKDKKNNAESEKTAEKVTDESKAEEASDTVTEVSTDEVKTDAVDNTENTDESLKATETDYENKAASEKVTAAFEMFPVKKDKVPADRINAICIKFINEALTMGQELKAGDLAGLSYEELCVLYNNMQMMKFKLEPKIQAIAGVVIENNIKVTRSRLIKELKKRTLYTIYTPMNHLPFSNNASFYLFTDKALAEAQIKQSDLKYLGLKEITEEHLEMHFDVFFITGFKHVIIDSGVRIPFADLYTAKEKQAYGLINPELCAKMIFFNQMAESIHSKAKEESRSVTDEEMRNINGVWADINEGLIKSSLLVPAEKTEDGKVKYKGIAAKDPQSKNWIAMFTDQIAVNTFFKSSQAAAAIKNPILSQFEAIKANDEFEGIIVNPGRESFRIPKRVLASRRVIKKDEKPFSENGQKTE